MTYSIIFKERSPSGRYRGTYERPVPSTPTPIGQDSGESLNRMMDIVLIDRIGWQLEGSEQIIYPIEKQDT